MTSDSPSHSPIETPQTQPQTDSSQSWLSSAASEAWSMTTGGARVAKDLAVGFATEAYEHPVKTLAEIGAGAVAAAAITEAGVGAVGTAAIAAVPLAGYGLYRGAQIAATEGIGAIPDHLAQTYQSARNFFGESASAIATDFSGSGSAADLQHSSERVQNLGGDAVPFAAGAIGGGLGETVAGMGNSLMRNLSQLPELSLEYAYVDPVPSLAGAASRTGQAIEATAGGSAAAGSGGLILNRTEGGQAGAAPESGARLDDYTRQQLFVEGRVGATASPTDESSLTGTLTNIFQNPEQILAQGGHRGNINLTRTADGWLEAQVTSGPMQDTVALFKPGDPSFIIERSSSSAQAHVIPMPGR